MGLKVPARELDQTARGRRLGHGSVAPPGLTSSSAALPRVASPPAAVTPPGATIVSSLRDSCRPSGGVCAGSHAALKGPYSRRHKPSFDSESSERERPAAEAGSVAGMHSGA